MFKLDITITATRRPEVLYETLYSFVHNLFGNTKCKALVNIDPVGPGSSEDVVSVVKEFFAEYHIIMPQIPNFSKAFYSVWSATIQPFVFHLEDDWKLLEKVDFQELIDIMLDCPDLASIRLPQFEAKNGRMKNWNKVFTWKGKFYQYHDKKDLSCAGFCGHPSLLRGEFVRKAITLFDLSINPEKQFHSGKLAQEVLKWDWAVYGKWDSPVYVQDIGRKWMDKNGYQKKGSKAFFMEWEKVK
jgi:hypothetical protein